MKKYSVYLVRCSDNTLYCGVTNNLKKRLREHNSGKAAKYTRGRTPVKLVAYKHGLTKPQALKLEYNIKQLPKHAKKHFLNKFKD